MITRLYLKKRRSSKVVLATFGAGDTLHSIECVTSANADKTSANVKIRIGQSNIGIFSADDPVLFLDSIRNGQNKTGVIWTIGEVTSFIRADVNGSCLDPYASRVPVFNCG